MQLSTDNGNEWVSIRTDRMVKGSGREQGRQDTAIYGFHGNFTGWVKQRCDLSEYEGKSVLLRLGLISDRSAQYDGWYISNMLIKEFKHCPFLSVEDDIDIENEKYVFRNSQDYVLRLPDELNNNELSVKCFDLLGNLVYQIKDKGSENITIPTRSWQSGLYFIKIISGDKQFNRQLLLTH
jgi:hypothetical protein